MDPNKELLHKRISGWLRQSKFRAKRSGVYLDAEFKDVLNIYDGYDYKCAYCGNDANSPDHPFPLKEKAPCVPANIVPCCDKCKKLKKGNIIQYYRDRYIAESQLQSIIKSMLSQKGGGKIKEHIKINYKS